jgi:hypothetical protein
MQSYEINQADVAVAISGSQNISYTFESNDLVQRIDRIFTPSGIPLEAFKATQTILTIADTNRLLDLGISTARSIQFLTGGSRWTSRVGLLCSRKQSDLAPTGRYLGLY